MKLLKIFFFVILNFILSSYALSQTTIGYIDLDRLVKDSKYGKNLITELEKIRINDIKNLKSEKDEIIKYENNLKNKKNILSNDELTNFFNKINPLIEDYMKINSIGILIDKKNVFIGMLKYDITDDIIKIINKNNE